MGKLRIGEETLLYILQGQDDFSLRQALEGIKKGIGDYDLLPANITMLEGQQLSLAQLRSICQTKKTSINHGLPALVNFLRAQY